jgi:peptidyl-prolyl cis-trans isomerase C
MHRKVTLVALAALALAACQGSDGAPKKSGPAVAKGEGLTITADEFKARLDEQSPFIRARFNTLERKKEFLDNLIRFELLAKEAERQGLEKDPDVQLMVKRMMVQKLVQKSFGESKTDQPKEVPEAELKQYYAAHQDEYSRPAKIRVAHLLVKAPAAGPERAKKEAEARKLLDRVRAEEKKDPAAFVALVRQASEDEATKGMGGDLGFKTQPELAGQLSPEAATAAFALQQDGQTTDVVPSAQGFHILKRAGMQEALERPFDAVKPQIQAKLQKDRRTKDFDDLVKRLRDQAKVAVNDAELEKVAVSGAAPGAAGGPHGAMGGMMGGAPPAAPTATPNAPAPAPKPAATPNAPAAQAK